MPYDYPDDHQDVQKIVGGGIGQKFKDEGYPLGSIVMILKESGCVLSIWNKASNRMYVLIQDDIEGRFALGNARANRLPMYEVPSRHFGIHT